MTIAVDLGRKATNNQSINQEEEEEEDDDPEDLCSIYNHIIRVVTNSPSQIFFQKNIRIYHECEGRIEKSVTRMTNGDPKGQFFLFYPHTNNGFFFLLTTDFIYSFIYFKISFQKYLNTLRCNST